MLKAFFKEAQKQKLTTIHFSFCALSLRRSRAHIAKVKQHATAGRCLAEIFPPLWTCLVISRHKTPIPNWYQQLKAQLNLMRLKGETSIALTTTNKHKDTAHRSLYETFLESGEELKSDWWINFFPLKFSFEQHSCTLKTNLCMWSSISYSNS